MCTKDSIEPGYRSDHSIIYIQLQFGRTGERGKTFWKFNSSLLFDKEYCKLVKKAVDHVKLQYAVSPYNPQKILEIEDDMFQAVINDQLFFEMILLEVRARSIEYASKKKQSAVSKENKLMKEIKTLEELQSSSTIRSELEI